MNKFLPYLLTFTKTTTQTFIVLNKHCIIFAHTACNCNREGSETMQCNHQTGQCQCREGIGGEKCDECARGFTGQAPYCQPCGECFDNWDYILTELKSMPQIALLRNLSYLC